ncbi:DNA recombination protein RmuC [uncultured Acetobacteroides sp.]|uniref:DNA recombination protein RmuC n=1 Tax=uncultured Acetobacteroides sp. TaxID=1760811 RepID=UPI0029F5A0C5|nr:DNA recombination protein RmuC [uncultured Acetobacteroides sp.]
MNSILTVLTISNLALIALILFLLSRLKELHLSQNQQVQEIHKMEESMREEFRRNREEFSRLASEGRKEQTHSFSALTTAINQQLQYIARSNEERMEKMRFDNNTMLERMRETVDEKLNKTLEERLGQSFKMVSERLELVHKGLGEMHELANGVGDLKKVLTNVKTRGIFGEIQLSVILNQILTPSQFGQNVMVKEGSKEAVEFAIKLPGKSDDEVLWLPIDSKFPMDVYHNLVTAYETGSAAAIQESNRLLTKSIMVNAKTISEKYINPPYTADFAIMFLPVEGLFAEVVRNSTLVEQAYRDYKVIITGPTTVTALLNSFQLGFKTLAIEKRSNEVWKLLSAVKTEFTKFGDVLEKTKVKLNQASNELDSLVGVRTRAIQQKLKGIEQLSENDASTMID